MTDLFTEFSLIVTCYNYERYIAECLNACLEQRYPRERFEVVCVDDGSTDGSAAVIETFRNRCPGLIAIRTENSGLEKACNQGIRISKFERVVRVDADDVLALDYLEKMHQAIAEHPSHDFYYCKKYYDYFSGSEMNEKSLPDFDAEEIFERGDFFATGTVYKKSDLMEAGLYPEGIKNCGLENYTLILSLIEMGRTGFAVPGATFNYRRHHANMSTVKRQAIIAYGQQLLRRYGRPFHTNGNHPYGLVLDNKGQAQGTPWA